MVASAHSPVMSPIRFSRRGNALIGQEMFRVLERARVLEAQGIEVLHLELGNPRLPPPEAAVTDAIGALQRLEVGYTYSAGHPSLRKAVAELYGGANGRALTEANVVISPANLIINQFLDLVCDPGDSVVFFTPAFPTYWAAARHIGLNVLQVPLDPIDGFDLTHDDVSRALELRPRAIIVNSANNPTGAVYGREVLDRLARECDRLGIWLLSDETYGELSYGKEFYSLVGLDLPHVIIMSSFSKIFSVPGYRIGFLVADPVVAAKFTLSVSTLISCLPIFTQIGCASGIRSISEYTANVRARCDRITKWCNASMGQCASIRFPHPAAGFYYFIDISATGIDDMRFAERLLEEEHTAVTPGSCFGAAYGGFVRIAICGKEEDVRLGVTRLTDFVGKLQAERGVV
ncbi:MAG: pyridoxal phosphate-dependent aminotransferase [Bacteroidales bacterium]